MTIIYDRIAYAIEFYRHRPIPVIFQTVWLLHFGRLVEMAMSPGAPSIYVIIFEVGVII